MSMVCIKFNDIQQSKRRQSSCYSKGDAMITRYIDTQNQHFIKLATYGLTITGPNLMKPSQYKFGFEICLITISSID